MKPLLAQARAETVMTLRRGESVLLALGIPVGLLAFFSVVDVLPTPTKHPVDEIHSGDGRRRRQIKRESPPGGQPSQLPVEQQLKQETQPEGGDGRAGHRG